MNVIDIRRLAAIDMYGAGGHPARRWIILAEFLAGAIVGTGLGIFVAITLDGVGWRIFGTLLALICLNYVPLALHALSLIRPGALERELQGVDTSAELKRYTVLQAWLAVPLLAVVLAPLQLQR